MKDRAAAVLPFPLISEKYKCIPRTPMEHLALKRQRRQSLEEWMVPTSNLRLFFMQCLCLVPLPILRNFWRSRIAEGLWRGTELELYQSLWDKNSQFSMYFHEEVFSKWEDFLVREKTEVVNKYRNMKGAIWLTGFYGADNMLWLLKNHVHRFFEKTDLIRIAQEIFSEVNAEALPGSWVDCFARKHSANGPCTIDQFFIPDIAFKKDHWYDTDLISTPIISNFPGIFGLLDEPMTFEMIADGRPVGEILKDVDWFLEGTTLIVQGRKVGEVVSFSSEMKLQGWKRPAHPALSRPVVKMHKNFHCKRRKRNVLKAGYLYGTPVYVARLTHPSMQPGDIMPARKRLLDVLATAISRKEPPEELQIAKNKFRELCSLAVHKLVFEFDGSSGILYLNEKRLFAGQAAKILRRILVDYVEHKRTDFEFIRFKYDPEITLNPKQSNFETIFRRIQVKLEKVKGVGIEKTVRGRFKLLLADPVEIRTADASRVAGDGQKVKSA